MHLLNALRVRVPSPPLFAVTVLVACLRMLTQKIRKAKWPTIRLSVYGHNVKIITKDGAVTLRGPFENAGAKIVHSAPRERRAAAV